MASRRTAVEYLTTTNIGEKGQLTVPKGFRDDLHLAAGAPVAVLRLGDGLFLLPEQRRFDRLCEEVRAALLRAGVTSETLLSTLPQARERVFARLYPKAADPRIRRRWRSRGRRAE